MHYIFIPRIIIALAALVHTVRKHVLSSILYHISPCPINFIPVLFKHSPSFALKRCTRTCSSLNCVFSPDRVLVENPSWHNLYCQVYLRSSRIFINFNNSHIFMFTFQFHQFNAIGSIFPKLFFYFAILRLDLITCTLSLLTRY
jgi:hypothetical protein